jgi:hypothetical protein
MSSWQSRFEAELRRRWRDVSAPSGWINRNNRTGWITGGPIGAVFHHTASSSDNGAVNTITNGWSGHPGPVYNVLVLSTGAVHLIAGGPANHAGRGSGAVRDRIRAGGPPGATGPDTMNGNQSFFGVSARHVGTNPNYPQAQLDAIVAVGAAFCVARGLNPTTCFHHREWSLRKIDMSWRGDLRGLVTTAVRGSTPAPIPPTTPPGGDDMNDADFERIRGMIRSEIRDFFSVQRVRVQGDEMNNPRDYDATRDARDMRAVRLSSIAAAKVTGRI